MSEDHVIIKGRKVKRSWLIDLLYRPPTRTEVLSIYFPKDLVNTVLRHILWYHHKNGNFDVFSKACDRRKELGLKKIPIHTAMSGDGILIPKVSSNIC